MTEVHLFDNSALTGVNAQGNPNPITWGVKFQVSSNLYFKGWRWYRPNSGAQDDPSGVVLWTNSGSVVAGPVTPTTTQTVGWKVVPLASPVLLLTGTTYVLGWHSPAGAAIAQGSSSNWSSPPSPFLADDHRRYYTENSALTFPVNAQDTQLIYLDGVFDTDGTPLPGATDETPATEGEVSTITDANLATWLSAVSGTNTHHSDGLPWLTWTLADAIKNATDALSHSGSGSSLDWVVALWKLAGNLTDLEYAAVRTFLKDGTTRLTGGSGGGGSAFEAVHDHLDSLAAGGVSPSDLGAQLAVLRERLTLSPDLSDDTRWTLVATVPGADDGLVNEQADVYFVTLNDIPTLLPQHNVAGNLWVPKWGWVAPRVHGHFTQRVFSDVIPFAVTAGGLLMDGVLIYAHPGTTWTVEAYVLDRS